MVSVIPTLLRDAVAGYNKDGTRIYIDVLVPGSEWTAYISHEAYEMVEVVELGIPYEEAHRRANGVERRVVEGMGLNWEEHQKLFYQILHLVLNRDPKPPNPTDLYIFA